MRERERDAERTKRIEKARIVDEVGTWIDELSS
jgi:hypothetical protein